MKEDPRGVIGCLTAGFEMLGQSPSLVVPPVVLDLILWLGPRVSVAPLLDRLLVLLQMRADADPEIAGQFARAMELLERFGERFNLLSLLSRLPLLHVPSLLAQHMPGRVSPLGEPRVFSLSSVLALIPWWAGLVIMGVVLGFLYLDELAHHLWMMRSSEERGDILHVQDDSGRDNPVHAKAGVWRFVRFFLFSAGLMAFGMVFSPPWLLIVAVATTVAQPLGLLVWLFGVGLISYTALHLIFVVPGLLLGGRGLLRAIWESVVLSHMSLPSVLGLAALTVVIYEGLGYAWSLPSGDSWALLIGVVGNAFVATGLTAAVFIFYQERLAVNES